MACCVTSLGRVCMKLTSLVLSSGESICSPTAGEMFSYGVFFELVSITARESNTGCIHLSNADIRTATPWSLRVPLS